MKTIVLRGRTVVGGKAEGEALVTAQTISGWGGIDAGRGVITERRHELRGQSFRDKIFIFPGVKGSSGGSATFRRARLAGTAPRALIFNEMTTRAALIAVATRVPALTGLNKDPLKVIQTGDWVKIDADAGVIEVTRNSG
jgi:predicted aconitase with swiveling domain